MALSRDDILNAVDLTTREVPVPQWGGSVLVRGLSGEERDAYEMSTMVERPKLGGKPGELEMVADLANGTAKLVARCIVGDDGERVFTDADVIALGKKSAQAMTAVWQVAAELSGITQAATDQIEGNSDAATDGGSESSDSPAPTA